MIDGSFTIDDIRFIVALGAIFEENDWAPLSLRKIGYQLKCRGISVGNGMTREINGLEEKIGGVEKRGVLLLDRKRAASTMTTAGKEILAKMQNVLQAFDEMQVTIDSGRTIVRVGLTNSLATNMFPRVLKESSFRSKFPKVDLEIVEGEPHELVGILQSRVDFAVGPRDVNNGFRSTALCKWKRVLLYNRNVTYKYDFSRSVHIETLREWLRHEEVLLPAPRIIPKLDKFLKPMLTGRRIIVPQAALRRLWVELGFGLAISYEEKRSIASQASPIGSIDLSSELGTTEMFLYQPSDQEPTLAAKALMDSISEIFSRDLPEEFRGLAM